MITILGSALGATWPLFVAAIPLATALLIYIFRSKGSAKVTITSTLFIVRKLPIHQPHRKRFIPPLQFWLELLACVLLALAASGLFVTATGKRVAVVLDVSKSMSSLQANNQTKLETSRRIAAADIAQSEPNTSFAVFTADDHLTPLSGNDSSALSLVSARKASSLLDGVVQSYAADRLASLVEPLISSGEYDGVWIYSDKTLESDSIDTRVKLVTIPSDPMALSNVWIDSLALSQSGATDATGSSHENATLVVRLGAVTQGERINKEVPVEVAAQCSNVTNGSSFSLPRATTRISSGDTVVLNLQPPPEPWDYCLVRASFSAGTIHDAIALDNEAWIAHSTTKTEVTVISSLTPAELGLTGLPYDIVAPKEPHAFAGSTRAIYHRTLPTSTPPTAPSLFILPPNAQALWGHGATSTSTITNAEITRWDEAHPLLRYVQPSLIAIPKGISLICPDSSQSLINTTAGALVCAGEEGGVRYIITGFELLPFDGLRSPTVSIFTLNALRWLFDPQHPLSSPGAGFAGSGFQVGVIKLPSHMQKIRRVAPDDTVIEPGAGGAVTISSPGVLVVSAGDANTSQDSYIAVNAFSREESDITSQGSLVIPSLQRTALGGDTPHGTSASPASARAHEKTYLESFLVAVLFIVLCIDLMRRAATRARWRGEAR